MAVVAVSSVSQYTGLDTDTKPTDGVSAGSLFWEFDTYAKTVKCWKYNGKIWCETDPDTSTDDEDDSEDTESLLGELLAEMAAIRKGMELKLALEHGVNIDLRTEEVTHLQEN